MPQFKTLSMPLTFHRLHLQQTSPFQRTLGLELMAWGGGRATVRMPPSARIALAAGGQAVDPLALVGLLDHGFADALSSAIPLDVGISTLELQVRFARSGPLSSALTLEAETFALDAGSATLSGVVRDEGGAAVAAGSALFRIGSFPTSAEPVPGEIGRYDPSAMPGPFARSLGLERGESALYLRGENPAAIGWEPSRILHGGATGALLMAACMDKAPTGQRLASLTIRYLRPGQAALALEASVEEARIGRAASFLSVVCRQEGAREVAEAAAVLVPD